MPPRFFSFLHQNSSGGRNIPGFFTFYRLRLCDHLSYPGSMSFLRVGHSLSRLGRFSFTGHANRNRRSIGGTSAVAWLCFRHYQRKYKATGQHLESLKSATPCHEKGSAKLSSGSVVQTLVVTTDRATSPAALKPVTVLRWSA